MKMRIVLVAITFILLLVSYPVLAALPNLKVDDLDTKSGKLKLSYNPSSFTASKSYSPSIQCERIGIIYEDIAKYKIKVEVGSGEYDSITLTNYVREKNPWKTGIDKNLVILPGQGLTEKFYSDMAIYYAEQGYSAYILDRRETNIPSSETNYTCMGAWTVSKHLEDTYEGIAASRIHTAFISGKTAESIKVTAIGHSHGALLLTAYEASEYDDSAQGSVNKIVPVDIIIKYNPTEQNLIQGQAQAFNQINASIQSGTYYDDNMKGMMGIAFLASTDPGNYSGFGGLTNIQFFRFMASQTYALSNYPPYTPDYHYWSGNLSGLYHVNETQLLNLTLTGGAVPYTPKYMDEYMAGLMGNIEGYGINSSRIDSPVLYVGLGGGFGEYGTWWYENEVGNINNHIGSINWNNQGHASLLIDQNSPELWELIDDWIKENN